jgi:predicted TIM-barrel fold metal-dependent hydrolase
MKMRRREVLKAGLCLAIPSSFLNIAITRAQQTPPGSYIDVHCHIFNAKDLPVDDFIKKVVLRHKIDDLKKQQPFLAKILTQHPQSVDIGLEVIASMVRESAPSVDDEIKFLDGFEKGINKLPDRHNQDIRDLKKIFKIIWNPRVLETKLKNLTAKTVVGEASLYLKYWLRREVYPQLSAIAGDDQNLHPENENDSDDIARHIYSSAGAFGHTLRWILLFNRYRFELAEMLNVLNGANDKPALLIPLLVDFEMWLRDVPANKNSEPSPSPVEDQVRVMSRISKRQSGPRMHGFVAYDPLRQCLYDRMPAKQRPKQSPLEVVQSAIMDSGFIGVKLYPPMGFFPYGNKGKKLPVEVQERYKLSADIGDRLDKALLDVYSWCCDNGVPITAHGRDSNDPYPGGGKLASPDFWETVLKVNVNGRNLNALKLNIAHVGEFKESLEQHLPDNDDWESKRGNLFKNYPNVFGDISYFDELIPVPHLENLNAEDERSQSAHETDQLDRKEKVLAKFRAFKNGFPNSAKFLMFGSDWIMLGIEAGMSDQSITNAYKYRSVVDKFLEDVGYSSDERKQIMFRNAVRFLGLAPGEKTHARLTLFYENNPAGLAWLSQFT